MTRYNPRSERSLLRLYPTLQPVESLDGEYVAELTGPAVFRPLQKLFLRLSGLPGWSGKVFTSAQAVNIIKRQGQPARGLKMHLAQEPQLMDSRQGMVARYSEEAPLIWRKCRDEFRQIDADTVLGASYFDLPFLRRRPIMFLLHKKSAA